MTSFDSLVAAAESLQPIEIRHDFRIPSPVELKTKLTNYFDGGAAVASNKKFNFDVLRAQLASMHKQHSIDPVYIPGNLLNTVNFMKIFKYFFLFYLVYYSDLSQNHTLNLDCSYAAAPLTLPYLPNATFFSMNPTETCRAQAPSSVEGKKGCLAKKVATAKREREGGKFKRVQTKWVTATDFFKPTKDDSRSP